MSKFYAHYLLAKYGINPEWNSVEFNTEQEARNFVLECANKDRNLEEWQIDWVAKNYWTISQTITDKLSEDENFVVNRLLDNLKELSIDHPFQVGEVYAFEDDLPPYVLTRMDHFCGEFCGHHYVDENGKEVN